jgi:Tol biopolymer transport system component
VQISNGNIDFFVQDVSYDGSRILYGSVTETSDLWKVDTLDASESVLANDVSSEYWADISTDGKSVVFQSVRQADRPYSGSIAAVPAYGGSRPTVLASAGFAPVWSRNGQWIACLRRSESGFAIWRIEPGSREAVKLAEGEILTPGYTASPYLKVGTNHLSWSPDSAMIAYSAKANGASNIWLVNVDASENRPITVNTDAKETYEGPTWSEDGSFLLFLSELRTQGPVAQTLSRVWLYNFANLDQRLLYESPERVRLLGLSGEKIVFAERPRTTNLTSNKETSYLFVQSLKTGARSRVSVLENAYFHNIHLSRDGNTIAFVSRGDNTTSMWTVPVDGGTPKKILTENDPKVMISNLAWVPDGRSIVFGRQTRTNLLSMLSK